MSNTRILEQAQRFLAALRHCQTLGLQVHDAMLHLLMFMGIPHLPKIIDFSIDYLRAGHYRDTYVQCLVWRQARRVANVAITAIKPSLSPGPVRTLRSTNLGPARTVNLLGIPMFKEL